jgi:ATP-binding cassette, subfamily F, member 3
LQRMDRVEAVATDKPQGNFNLKKVERAGQNILTVEELSIGYGEKVLARNINLTLTRGEALGVIGGNGTGKTTFLKTVLGNIREISGKIIWGTKTDIGYYSQNLEDLDDRNEVIQELRRVAPLAENGALRSFLARFLFSGEDVFKSVKDLSGGEKGRLALAKLIYSNKNVLVLDEPTNHLDIPSREALEDALDAYQGTIITVSHDRFFLDKIATQILSFEEAGRVEHFDGNYSEFHDWKERKGDGEKGRKGERQTAAETPASSEAEFTPADASLAPPPAEIPKPKSDLSKNQLQRIESRIKEIEESIPLHEEELTRLTAQMGQPEVAADHAKLQQTNDRYAATERKIQALYEEWENLSGQL